MITNLINFFNIVNLVSIYSRTSIKGFTENINFAPAINIPKPVLPMFGSVMKCLIRKHSKKSQTRSSVIRMKGLRKLVSVMQIYFPFKTDVIHFIWKSEWWHWVFPRRKFLAVLTYDLLQVLHFLELKARRTPDYRWPLYWSSIET